MKLSELKKVLHEAISVMIYVGETDKLLYKGFVRNIEIDCDVIQVYPSVECDLVIIAKENENV